VVVLYGQPSDDEDGYEPPQTEKEDK